MPYNLRSTTARTDNSVLPASSRSTNSTPITQNTHALVHPSNMSSFAKDLCLALADPSVILALGMIIENKNAELLSNFDGRMQDLEEKVNARNNRISSLEYELQGIRAKATRSIDGMDELEQYSRLNSVRIQHPQWVESPTENCVYLVIDYAKINNINLILGDFDACHRIWT